MLLHYSFRWLLLSALLIANTLVSVHASDVSADTLERESSCHELLDYVAPKLRSPQSIDFCESFAGKALLLVNTASQCGYTPQFKGLEALHKKYGERLAVVGFPSADFRQEFADSKKIGEVCYVNYGVTFTVLEPSAVTGKNANSLFRKLALRTGKEPSWNFNKYLVSADGDHVQYFASNVKPNDPDFIAQLKIATEVAGQP